MAKRSSYRKARTLQPAVMRINYAIPAGESSTSYISLSHDLSKLNRRFYRQGLNWAVANVKITSRPAASSAIGSQCYVSTIPHTWAVANSWMKSYSLWNKQQTEALEASNSTDAFARYRDFKVSMEISHVVDEGSPLNLKPVSVGPPQFPYVGTTYGLQISQGPGGIHYIDNSEEWVGSEIVVPNDGAAGVNVNYTLHMIGPDGPLSKGMIQGYADSRSVPESPAPSMPGNVSTSWMQEMFDVGNDSHDVADNAQNRNDELPYDQIAYPGGSGNFAELENQGYVLNQSTTGMNTMNTGPFTAPCGLIKIITDGQSADITKGDYTIVTVELVPGSHRGYLCETMEEF